MTRRTRVNFISLICASFIMSAGIANAGPTTKTPWKVVDKSMGALLGSGWKIISHSAYRVVRLSGTLGETDETTLSYILYKDGKYINCLIYSPRPDDAVSGCRLLSE